MIPLAVLMAIYFYNKKKGQKFGRVILVLIAACMLLAWVGLI